MWEVNKIISVGQRSLSLSKVNVFEKKSENLLLTQSKIGVVTEHKSTLA